MPLVFLSKRLKEEEQSIARSILEKYDKNIGYTEIPNDSKIDLIVRTKSDILTSQKYKTLNVTFQCLMQMDSQNINPFLFEPRNVGLRNLFLLGKTISIFEIQFNEPIINLIKSMGGVINESSDLNNADIIITDQKYTTPEFTIPLVSSSWIYAISNQTIETSYEKYLITNEKPNSTTNLTKVSSQQSSPPKINEQNSNHPASQTISIKAIKDEQKFKNINKKENISASLLNMTSKPSKPQRRRNILNCIRPISKLSPSQNEACEDIPRPSVSNNDIENDIKSDSKLLAKEDELADNNDDEVYSLLEVDSKKELNNKVICNDLPVPDTPEKLMQNSPRRKQIAFNSSQTVSPKLNAIMQILSKKSHKKNKKSNDNLNSDFSIEELNEFSQIPHDDDNEDDFNNDVYYDNTHETQTQNEQHSTQMDEEVLFRMLEA